MNRIIIWGTGTLAARFLNNKEFKEEKILCFVDNDYEKQGRLFRDKRVISLEELVASQMEYDLLIVLTIYSESIYDQCLSKNMDMKKIVFLDNVRKDGTGRVLNEKQADISDIYPGLGKEITQRQERGKSYIACRSCSFDYGDEEKLLGNGPFANELYLRDYFRFRTFELVANEVIRTHVEGAVAEVGVFMGTFSALINMKFSDRLLYLFDTFEGFSKEEFKKEVKLGRCDESFHEIFEETSVEAVLEKMPIRQNCIIRKGLFPGSAKGLEEEKYAFVSIDVDLEESIFQSLCYFYPRVSIGGYIFIHDYNCSILEGVKEAVRRFEEASGIQLHKVPIADGDGTLIISR